MNMETQTTKKQEVETCHKLSLMHCQKGEVDEAITNLEKVVDLNPDDASAYHNLGVLFYSSGELEKAEHNFKRALELEPFYAEAVFGFGKICQKYDEENGTFRLKNYASEIRNKIDDLRKNGRREQALVLAEKLARLLPNDSESQFCYAVVSFESGKIERAKKAITTAKNLNPTSEDIKNMCILMDKNQERSELQKCRENNGQINVTFLDPAAYNLLPLWREMSTRPNVRCQWALTLAEQSYALLKTLGVDRIVFDPAEPRAQKLEDLLAPLQSDIIVSSSWGRADSLNNDIPKVQTFHALGNKAYFVKPPLAKRYDLLLFPSFFHRNLYVKYKVFPHDDPRLKVVGWHRIDRLADPVGFDRFKINESYGVDPDKPKIFYAPTWGVYGPHGIFYRWFENEFEVLRELCEYVGALDAQLLVKFHPTHYREFKAKAELWEKFHAIIDTYEHVFFIDTLENEDPQELLFITDVLITDISSIFADFLPLNRPVIFIEPQWDLWEQTEICSSYRAGFIVSTPQQLCEAIADSLKNPDRYEHARKRIFNKLVYKFDGNAAKRGVDEILRLVRPS